MSLPALLPLSVSFLSFEHLRGILLLAFGFGFVVFFHELGHFLAAKWAGVKVEQFAVGFGQAVIAWRKGLGLRVGTTTKEFKRRIRDHLNATGDRDAERAESSTDEQDDLSEMEVARGAKALGISETEYRLNWIPLGGYVKMLGQDDLKPNSQADDPRAYNRQTIGKRMVIVSAGVIMNIILAAIGFMVLFLVGFHVPPAQVGNVVPASPAQQAGIQVGDRILTIAGRPMHADWTKVELASALADPAEPTQVEIERTVDGKPQRISVMVKPRTDERTTKDILRLGIEAAYGLKIVGDQKALKEFEEKKAELTQQVTPDQLALNPGDTVKSVNGEAIADPAHDFIKFDGIVQASGGRPLQLTVVGLDGKTRDTSVRPRFIEPFGDEKLNFAGMLPRVRVEQVREGSPAAGEGENGLKPGDVIESITTGAERNTKLNPTFDEFRHRLNAAGWAGQPIEVSVRRGDRSWTVSNLRTIKIDPEQRGLSVGIGYELDAAVVSDVEKDSPAARANVPSGARIVEVGGQPAANWSDVHRLMLGWLDKHSAGAAAAAAAADTTALVPVTYESPDGERKTAQLALSSSDADLLRDYRYRVNLAFDQPSTAVRKASGPVEAIKWGVNETWDFTLQFYLTLHRMVTGGVSAKNLMGPVGIFQAGTGFASKGGDWLLWFLAMISANLAVVNFLPIPIVDGGLFTFLILEKIKGKPLSAKAQTIAQYVGLALLLGVFLFVTYQDVINFQFRMR
jgi:regulator of sigma E protease